MRLYMYNTIFKHYIQHPKNNNSHSSPHKHLGHTTPLPSLTPSFASLPLPSPTQSQRFRGAQGGRKGQQAPLAALHVEHEDHLLHGAGRHDARDPQGAGRQQLRLRATRALPAPLRPRRRSRREPGPMGDGGVQAAPPLPQRRALQKDIGDIYRLQEHRLQNRQRVKAVNWDTLIEKRRRGKKKTNNSDIHTKTTLNDTRENVKKSD